MSTLIIAEAGVNHNGDMGMARELVAAAAEAGADLIKFQSFKSSALVSQDAPKADYQKGTTDPNESQLDMIRALELSVDDHHLLVAECRRRGVGFFSTAFDPESFDLLVDLGVRQVKVPSGELTNVPYLRHVARHGFPLFLSTGMSTLGEVESALATIEAAGTPRSAITVLHCTTEYPAPIAEVNLRAMTAMGEAFGVAVGYSDHTQGIHIPVAAVALGAVVIEKHFTLDRSLPGPDHRASLEPQELVAMVRAIRNVECALGDGIKRPSASELKNRPIGRRSIVASAPIAKGDLFSPENLTTKRPGTGVCASRWDEVMGRPADRAYAIDEPLAR